MSKPRKPKVAQFSELDGMPTQFIIDRAGRLMPGLSFSVEIQPRLFEPVLDIRVTEIVREG